jgi:lipopolysaccharide assembly outer membrane protein LptD (OstA)
LWRGDSVSCERARFVPADSVVHLFGAVRLLGADGSFLGTPDLFYDHQRGVALLTGPVIVRDSTATYSARADTGWFFEERESLQLARHCTLLISGTNDETVQVASDSLMMDNLTQQVTATQNVSFMGNDVTGSCGRMVFSRAEDNVVLTDNPEMKSNAVECRAKRIVLQRREGILRQIVLEKEAHALRFAAPTDSVAGDETWGKRMVLWLDKGSPTSMLVTGDGRAFHHVLDAQGELSGSNTVEGDSLYLGLSADELSRIRVSGKARGTYTPADKGEDLPGEDVVYGARRLEYDTQNDLLEMTGSAELESGTVRLTASRVVLSVSGDEMIAEGDAVLKDKDQLVEGDAMTFNLSRRQGVVQKGSTQFEEAFSFGKRVARIDNKRLSIGGGLFTTCDREHPHFYITSPRMRVAMDDKVVSKPVTLWIHDVPVFWLPYWVFPIRRGRHSGFLMPHFSFRNIVGLEGSHARIEDIGYYFIFGDYADLTLSLDWQENQGWTLQGSADYALRYRLTGDISASYARRDKTQWILSNRHQQFLPYGFRLTSDIRATGSKQFLDDQTWNTEQRIDQNSGLRSDVTVSKNILGWSFRTSLKRNQTWETESVGDSISTRETIATTLPEIAISKPAKRIFPHGKGTVPWYKELYASLSSSFKNAKIRTEDENGVEEHYAGTVHTTQLSWRLPSVARRLTLSPRASYRESWIHLGKIPASGDRMENDRQGVLYNMGVSASTKLYGLFYPPLGPVVAFRHVMTPQVTYSYTPDWFLYGWDFNVGRFSEGDGDAYQQSGFGSSFTKSRRLNLSLNNLFQAKLQRGEEIIRKDNLATLNLSTSYDLEAKDDDRDPWSTLSTTFNFAPTRVLSWSLRMSHDPNQDLEFQSLSSTASLRLRGGWDRPPMLTHGNELADGHRYAWSLSATHTYSHIRHAETDQQNLQVRLGFAPTNGWDLQAALSYDVMDRKILSRSLSLVRDLHCWRMNFTWSQTERYWDYRFKVFVVAYPQALFVEHKERG